MAGPALIVQVIRDALRRMPFAPVYVDEQRDLQPYIQTVLQSVLQESFSGADLRTTISVGGTGKPRLSLV